MDPTPAKRRRWLRFSLRTFFVVFTLLCIWLAIKVNAARRQHEAVTAIRKSGGRISVWLDYQVDSAPTRADTKTDPQALPPSPAWLRNLFGDDFFHDASFVSYYDPVISAFTLAQLTELTELKHLWVFNTKFIIDGSGVKRPLKDADLAVLKNLSRLQQVVLDDADINGSGLRYIANCRALTYLELANTQVDDTGMEQISKMTTLKYLLIDRSRVTDIGLKQLRKLTNLRWLGLDGNNISDSGLSELKVLINLKYVDLHNTHVTPEGIRELQKALPTMRISGP